MPGGDGRGGLDGPEGLSPGHCETAYNKHPRFQTGLQRTVPQGPVPCRNPSLIRMLWIGLVGILVMAGGRGAGGVVRASVLGWRGGERCVGELVVLLQRYVEGSRRGPFSRTQLSLYIMY